MKTKVAAQQGFKKFIDGIWRKPISRTNLRTNRIGNTWQTYIEKICKKCGDSFLASHKKNVHCSKSCGKLGHSYTKGIKYTRTAPKKQRICRAGYYEILSETHPNAKKGRVLEHRFIMEKKIGRFLDSNEHVHHINGNKLDNRSENLVVLTRSEHMSVHNHQKIMERNKESGRFKKLIGIKSHIH